MFRLGHELLKAFFIGWKFCPFLSQPLAKIKQNLVMWSRSKNGKLPEFEQMFLKIGFRLIRFSSEIRE